MPKKRLKYFEVFDKDEVIDAIQKAEKNKLTGKVTKYVRPDFVFETWDDIDRIWKGLVTRGGTYVQIGPKKAGKTRNMHCFSAAFCDEDGEYDIYRCNLPKDSHLLCFDTEIAKHIAQDIRNGVMRSAGLKKAHPNFHFFPMSQTSDPATLMVSIVSIIRDYASEYDVGAVIIDVMTDCVYDINERSEALDFFRYIGALSKELNFAFLGNMHQNKNSNNSAGTFGLIAQQKADFAVNMIILESKEGDKYVKVFEVDRRTREVFHPFVYLLSPKNDFGLPVYLEPYDDKKYGKKTRRR